MSDKEKLNNNRVRYINTQMQIINNSTDDIYEALMDDDVKTLNSTIDYLISVLRDSKQINDEL